MCNFSSSTVTFVFTNFEGSSIVSMEVTVHEGRSNVIALYLFV